MYPGSRHALPFDKVSTRMLRTIWMMPGSVLIGWRRFDTVQMNCVTAALPTVPSGSSTVIMSEERRFEVNFLHFSKTLAFSFMCNLQKSYFRCFRNCAHFIFDRLSFSFSLRWRATQRPSIFLCSLSKVKDIRSTQCKVWRHNCTSVDPSFVHKQVSDA